MPVRPYRLRELHDHRVRSGGSWQAARAKREHPDWPVCAGGCGWPLHPSVTAGYDGAQGVFDRHPMCDEEARKTKT